MQLNGNKYRVLTAERHTPTATPAPYITDVIVSESNAMFVTERVQKKIQQHNLLKRDLRVETIH